MPQRIAVIFEYPSLNGGEHSMLQAIDVIDAEVFEFIAVAPGRGKLADALARRSIEHAPFEFHDQAGQRLTRQSLCEHLVQTLDGLSPDLVHANSLAMGRLTGAIQDQLQVPCVTHLRDILTLSGAAVNDINANRLIIAVSQATREFHVQQGIDAARTSVIYNTVDCQRFAPRPATGSLRCELNLPQNSFIALTIGQIGLRKAQDVLAEAAPAIAAAVPDVHFVIAGERNSIKAESIEFERNLLAGFQSAGMANRLHQIGYRDDVECLLNEADLLVHPAKQEPLGRVLLEAAASGLAIVATDVGGTAEILRDRVSARLVAPADAAQLAQAVIELAGDPIMHKQYAEAAHQRIVRDFSAQKTGAQLGDVWRQIIEDTKPES